MYNNKKINLLNSDNNNDNSNDQKNYDNDNNHGNDDDNNDMSKKVKVWRSEIEVQSNKRVKIRSYGTKG